MTDEEHVCRSKVIFLEYSIDYEMNDFGETSTESQPQRAAKQNS